MKVIVPLAGKGTRLLPLTKRVPKPLVRVAGRPVMDYVMDTVAGFDVEDLPHVAVGAGPDQFVAPGLLHAIR